MITGAAAAEAALCVIDVSEGIKPQTWEHLAVLELLGITDGVIALTKCDLVDELTIEKRRQEIVDAFAHSPVTWHAIVPTSAHNNSGIDALTHAIEGYTNTWAQDLSIGIDEPFAYEGKNHTLSVLGPADPKDGDYLWLPFYAATSGEETYGGGRYLDLELAADGTVEVDFNFAYNPLCDYNPEKYNCTLPPAENRLPFAVRAGEKLFRAHE